MSKFAQLWVVVMISLFVGSVVTTIAALFGDWWFIIYSLQLHFILNLPDDC